PAARAQRTVGSAQGVRKRIAGETANGIGAALESAIHRDHAVEREERSLVAVVATGERVVFLVVVVAVRRRSAVIGFGDERGARKQGGTEEHQQLLHGKSFAGVEGTCISLQSAGVHPGRRWERSICFLSPD